MAAAETAADRSIDNAQCRRSIDFEIESIDRPTPTTTTKQASKHGQERHHHTPQAPNWRSRRRAARERGSEGSRASDPASAWLCVIVSADRSNHAAHSIQIAIHKRQEGRDARVLGGRLVIRCRRRLRTVAAKRCVRVIKKSDVDVARRVHVCLRGVVGLLQPGQLRPKRRLRDDDKALGRSGAFGAAASVHWRRGRGCRRAKSFGRRGPSRQGESADERCTTSDVVMSMSIGHRRTDRLTCHHNKRIQPGRQAKRTTHQLQEQPPQPRRPVP